MGMGTQTLRAGVMACVLVMGACDPAPPASDPVANPKPPATQKVAAPATTQAAAALSVFMIGLPEQPDRTFTFPPAKLVLREIDGQVRASLFSMDPPEALREGYTGNSFFLEMTFDAPMDHLAGQTHLMLASHNQKPDDDTGIFIAGRRQMLQPLEAAVQLQQIDDRWIASIAGKFQLFEQADPDQSTVTVALRAQLTPETVIRNP